MPEYLAPGVFVEETSFRAKTIEGVSTTTTGFIGGQQFNFNLYNFTRRINFKPREEVVLLAKFPSMSTSWASIC